MLNSKTKLLNVASFVSLFMPQKVVKLPTVRRSLIFWLVTLPLLT